MSAALLLVLAGYLLGSIPTSYLVARSAKSIDLRQWGSGNLGATNLYRAAGLPLASLAVIVDIGKGFAPTYFFPQLDGIAAPEMALAYGAAALMGHIFPLWMRFRGGKGIATGGGVYLALAPLAVGVALVVWIAVVFTRRIVSIGSLLAATILPALVWVTGHHADYVFWSTVPVAILVWWTHRENVRRLLAGRELPAKRGVGGPEGGDPAESQGDL